MKICPYCNSEILDEAVFCVHCKSTLEVIAAKIVNPDVKICSYCGNKCYKNAVLCVECGKGFESVQKTSGKKSSNINKVISVVSIVLHGIVLIFSIISLLINLQVYGLDAISLLNMIPTGVVLIGLILGKKNKIVAIGYGLSALMGLISLFTGTVDIYSVRTIILVARNAIIALLYTGNKALRKVWFIPTALSFLSATIITIFNLANGYMYEDYYSSYDVGQAFLLSVLRVFSLFFPAVMSVIQDTVTSYNAKLNWYNEE